MLVIVSVVELRYLARKNDCRGGCNHLVMVTIGTIELALMLCPASGVGGLERALRSRLVESSAIFCGWRHTWELLRNWSLPPVVLQTCVHWGTLLYKQIEQVYISTVTHAHGQCACKAENYHHMLDNDIWRNASCPRQCSSCLNLTVLCSSIHSSEKNEQRPPRGILSS